MTTSLTKDLRTYNLDWIGLILFLIVMMDSAWVLAAADWTEHLGLVSFVTVCAVIAGAALARSSFSGLLSTFFAAAYGLFTIGWQLGLTQDPVLSWHDRSINLLGRMGIFLRVLLTGETNHDPLMFVMLMAVLYWVMAVWGAWAMFRRGRAWLGLLVPGFAVVTNTFYYVGEARIELFLVLYVFLALVLLIRSDILLHKVDWQRMHSRVPGDVDVHINRAGIILALFLVAVAWLSPVLTDYETVEAFWSSVTAPIRSVRDRVGDAFGGLRTPVSLRAEQYGETLSLTAGIQPEDSTVMEVDPERLPSGGGRLYWRSRIYDVYQDGLWSLSMGTEQRFNPDEGNLVLPEYEGRETVRVTVRAVDSAFQVVYVPSQPMWVNRTSTVTRTGSSPDSLEGLSFASDQIVMQGEEYRARGAVASPNEEQLRAAGEQYPDWIADSYLQLPEDFPQSIRDLAAEITEGLETPYEQAVAITRWLRSNIDYNRVTESPPEDRDPLEWFLFDYKVGFCNYYASAEVVMLRSLGVPARMAAGYARGTYDAIHGLYVVRGEDAHTWPEVYFPGLGWVEFEPTSSQPALDRPRPQEEEDPLGGILAEGGGPREEEDPFARLEEQLNLDEEPADLDFPPERRSTLGYWAAASLALLAAFSIWRRLDPTRWLKVQHMFANGMSRIGMNRPAQAFSQPGFLDTPTGRIYARWSGWLERLGIAVHPAQTPHERGALFADALPEEAERGWVIVDAYTRERFALAEVDPSLAQSSWRAMVPQLLFARVWKLTERWRR